MFKRLIKNRVAQNAGWMVYGQGARFGLQALYFIVLARILGASELGEFASVAALASIFAAFAGLGSGNVMMMRMSCIPENYPKYFGNALFLTAITSIGLSVVFGLTAYWLLPNVVSLTLVVGLVFSEFVAARVVDQCGQAFVALDQHRVTAHYFTVFSASRAASVVLFAFFSSDGSAESWVIWLAVSSLCTACFIIWRTTQMLGRPIVNVPLMRREMGNGFFFSVGLASRNVYSDIDKAMLARFAPLDAVGAYTAAYRLVTMAFVPVSATLYAVASRFFRSGQNGILGALSFSRRVFPIAVGYGVIAAIGLYFFAPIIPAVFGDDYTSAVSIARWLAVLPLIQAVHYVLADTLTSAGMQMSRSVIQILIAVLNVVLCIGLIKPYGVLGACWATLLSEFLLGVCLACWVAMSHVKAASGTVAEIESK